MSCELDFAPVYVFYNKQVDSEWRWSYQIYLVVFRICLLSPFFSFKWSYLRVGLSISSTGVDLMLWAHEHSYERLFPIYDRQVREHIGVTRIAWRSQDNFYSAVPDGSYFSSLFFVVDLQWISWAALYQPLCSSTFNHRISGRLITYGWGTLGLISGSYSQPLNSWTKFVILLTVNHTILIMLVQRI